MIDCDIIPGDARDCSFIESDSMHLCVTSPPYWGMRSYAGDEQSLIWGGSSTCAHQWFDGPKSAQRIRHGAKNSTLRGGNISPAETFNTGTGMLNPVMGSFCDTCGAWRGKFGEEAELDCLAWAKGVERCTRCYICHS